MRKLFILELKRNSLKTYHTAVIIIAVAMLGFIYFFAAIPKLDLSETDVEMFMTYKSLT